MSNRSQSGSRTVTIAGDGQSRSPGRTATVIRILMGATAIIVLAGARILGLPPALAVVRATAGFVEGFSFALWAFGTWWIPLLVVLGFWRHIRHHWPLSYEPALWSVVFPLGMYSVAMLTFGKVAHLAFMEPLSRFMLWVAVTAWVAVAAEFLARILGASGLSFSGNRRGTTGRTEQHQPPEEP
jgi:tellurite resistance protein TehA-like permease